MRYKTKLLKTTNNATPGRRARVTANEPYRKQYVNSLTTGTQTTCRNEKNKRRMNTWKRNKRQ